MQNTQHPDMYKRKVRWEKTQTTRPKIAPWSWDPIWATDTKVPQGEKKVTR